jgi:hypothetical protein
VNRPRWTSRQLDIARKSQLATLDEVDPRAAHVRLRIDMARIRRRWPWLSEKEGLELLRRKAER